LFMEIKDNIVHFIDDLYNWQYDAVETITFNDD
jgi:uncharacterized protein (UPF0333 family)